MSVRQVAVVLERGAREAEGRHGGHYLLRTDVPRIVHRQSPPRLNLLLRRERMPAAHPTYDSAAAMRSSPLTRSSSDRAYDSRTYPGAPNPSPGTSATLDASNSASHS